MGATNEPVTLRLADNLDIARGDLICQPNNAPEPLRTGAKYTIKHTNANRPDRRPNVQYQLDVNCLHRNEGIAELKLNEIGRVRLRTTVPLLCDEYRRNRTTGGFNIINETTNRTVAAGMIPDTD